jgi:hypothetical protein
MIRIIKLMTAVMVDSTGLVAIGTKICIMLMSSTHVIMRFIC